MFRCKEINVDITFTCSTVTLAKSKAKLTFYLRRLGEKLTTVRRVSSIYTVCYGYTDVNQVNLLLTMPGKKLYGLDLS